MSPTPRGPSRIMADDPEAVEQLLAHLAVRHARVLRKAARELEEFAASAQHPTGYGAAATAARDLASWGNRR